MTPDLYKILLEGILSTWGLGIFYGLIFGLVIYLISLNK